MVSVLHRARVLVVFAFAATCNGSGGCDSPDLPDDWRPACLKANLFFSNGTDHDALPPELANGNIGTLVGSGVIHAAGLFDGDALGKFGQASHRATVPAVEVEVLGLVQPVLQALHVEHGVFYERGATSLGLDVETRRYAHASRPQLMVHEISVTNPGATEQEFTLTAAAVATSPELDLTQIATAPPHTYAVNGQNKVPEDATTTATSGTHTEIAVVAGRPCGVAPCNATTSVPAKSNATHIFITVIVTSLSSSNVVEDAVALYKKASAEQEKLLPEHVDAWRARWGLGGVAVDGDLRLAQAINASLYSIRSSIREDVHFGLSPGGLCSDGYGGHSFWDTETWMWPSLLMLDPPSARSALQYRFDRRAGAAAKAERCGQPNEAWCGASYSPPNGSLMYPWESAHTGVEVQYKGGKLGPWGEYEQHISGDISFAARQYFYATQDLEWLRSTGFPLIRGIALFYAARTVEVEGGAYVFNTVMGPDEYAWPVNNSAYSNAVASLALAAAAEFAPLVNETVPSKFKEMADGLLLSVAVKPLPKEEAAGRTGSFHPEYDGYPTTKLGSKVKQADAVMLSYPFGIAMDAETQSNDLWWYEPRTDPGGPAMTWGLFAIGALDTHNFTLSKKLFRRGFENNVHPPFQVWTERVNGGCTPFITGAGGFLQSVVFGTSGMRIQGDRLAFNPPPPSATGGETPPTALTLRGFHYRGSTLSQRVEENNVTYTLDSKGATGLVLVDHASNVTYQLELGQSVALSRGMVSILPAV